MSLVEIVASFFMLRFVFQMDIFQLVGAPFVENCLAGFNSSIFAYGQVIDTPLVYKYIFPSNYNLFFVGTCVNLVQSI